MLKIKKAEVGLPSLEKRTSCTFHYRVYFWNVNDKVLILAQNPLKIA